MTKHTEPLNDEQIAALAGYASQMRKYGMKDWKSQLRNDWMRAGAGTLYSGEWGYLQQVRNQFGPNWLNLLTDEELHEAVSSRSLTVSG